MKKLALLSILIVLAFSTSAQVSFSVTTIPCNHNGVLSSDFSSASPPLIPPVVVSYTLTGTPGSTVTHTGVSGLTDLLTSYSGGPLSVLASDAFGNFAYGSFAGMPVFGYNYIPKSVLCPGVSTDSVDVFTGGTAPYTYQWIDLTTRTTVGTSNPISLAPGTYGVEITDALGCVYGAMDEHDASIIPYVPSYSVTTTSTVANCSNGTASVSVSPGAVLPVSYIWSTGATTPAILGLVTGSYNITVSDAIGCTASASAYVPQAVTIAAPVTPTPATCTSNNGAIIAFGSGGLPPYGYLWSNGATTQSQTGLSAGYYTVTVTDANGCVGSGAGAVGVSTPITVTYSTTPTLCTSPTGSATLSIAGGTPPYSTMWYTTPAQTGITAVNLTQGNFSFLVADAVGCIRSGAATVPPIDVIVASFSSVAPICTLSTGSITVTASSGVAPYTYAWSNGATTSSISGVPSNWYHVTVTDVNNCTATYSEYLPYTSTLSVGMVETPATCLFVSDGVLTAVPYGGTTPYYYAWTGGGSTSTITGLPAGIPYTVIVTDALGCQASSSVTMGADTLSSCYCTISGTVYNDANGNCTQDPGEAGIPNIKINISGRGYTFTDASGNYSYKVPSGTYIVSENVLAFYPLSPCQSNYITFTSSSATGCVLPVNFANTMDTIHDLHICTWDYNLPVPGHIYNQVTIITNNGTVPEPAVYTGYAPDGQFFAPLSFVPSGYFLGGSNFYSTVDSFPLLTPGAQQAFYMAYNVPTDIPLGTNVIFIDTITADSPATNWLLDYSPWNNTRYFTTTVVGPFDPNFKEVYPKGVGSAGLITAADTILEYMVHFQNTGTYQAENIRVVDTLDDNLDWTSLVPISGQCQVTVDQYAGKKIATFMFNEINLPPASSEPITSNAMFSYSIKTLPGLPVGTQFKNSASIYFDYNAPVKTNQTLNTLGSLPEHTGNVTARQNVNSFSVYPNPASTRFTAIINSDIAGNANMNITDVTGKILMNTKVNVQKGRQSVSSDISQLTPGVYFVNFTQNGKSQIQKLVVIKQ